MGSGLKTTDTTGLTLPNNVIERKVVPIYKFDRETGDVTATVQEKSNLYLRDLLGTLPGSRITVSSITEDQLSLLLPKVSIPVAEPAERTFDQAGSYLVNGFDSFIGTVDDTDVEVITNAGRSYIQGFRHQRDRLLRHWFLNRWPPNRFAVSRRLITSINVAIRSIPLPQGNHRWKPLWKSPPCDAWICGWRRRSSRSQSGC